MDTTNLPPVQRSALHSVHLGNIQMELSLQQAASLAILSASAVQGDSTMEATVIHHAHFVQLAPIVSNMMLRVYQTV